jgi:uncharacterized protein YjiS (DUF1127 family)
MTYTTAIPANRRLSPDMAGIFDYMLSAAGTWLTYRKLIRQIRNLDDQLLADIGIARGEITAVCRKAAYGR